MVRVVVHWNCIEGVFVVAVAVVVVVVADGGGGGMCSSTPSSFAVVVDVLVPARVIESSRFDEIQE